MIVYRFAEIIERVATVVEDPILGVSLVLKPVNP
jgi:hypothetical protein